MQTTDVQVHDSVIFNEKCRVEYVGNGPYSISVVNLVGDRFDLDASELALLVGGTRNTVATWTVKVDENGRRV